MVEQNTVNVEAVGSNPTLPAKMLYFQGTRRETVDLEPW